MLRPGRSASADEGPLSQAGFTLIELLLATLILILGVAAVGELVPKAMQSNLRNRYDSTSVVAAERELNQMIAQPLAATQFTDADGRTIALGSVTSTGLAGNPLLTAGAIAKVNFLAPAVAGYSFSYVDPNDATQISYEVRWTVITTVQGSTVVSKRFLVGVWKRDPRGPIPPVTVESWVQR